MKSIIFIVIGMALLSVFLFVQWTEALSSKTETEMKQIQGWIPLEHDEEADPANHVCIYDIWYKKTTVWIPGTANTVTELFEATHFKPMDGEEKENGGRCANCGQRRLDHIGPYSECKAKNENGLRTGRKY